MKNTFTDPFIKRPPIPLTIRALIMRISQVYILILVTAIMSVAKPGSSQSIETTAVKLEINNEPLTKVFEEIEKQTNFLFSWAPEKVQSLGRVSITRGQYTVKDVLEIVLRGKGLRYRQEQSYVLIFPESESNKATSEDDDKASTDYEATRVASLITGIVKDAVTQEPLPGVNIIVKGTTKGTTTDVLGKFVIDAEENDILVFSFIGFKPFETSIAGRSNVDVSMEIDITALKEVEVRSTGYWEETKDKSTGNIAKITAREISKQPLTNPIMSLQGRVAGLDITPYSGLAGGAVKVQIRGENSIRGRVGSYPLFIVDGIPVDSSPLQSGSSTLAGQGFDPLATIDPENIESIEVLKDGQATSIYGSRGANGVIIIKTKAGQRNGKTNVDIGFYSGVGQLSHQVEMLNTQQYVDMRKEALANDNLPMTPLVDVDLLNWDTTRYTNWQEKLLGGSARVNDVRIGISAGGPNTSFRFSVGGHSEKTIYPGDFGYKRFTSGVNLNHTSNDHKFSITLALNYGVNKSQAFNDANFFQYVTSLSPNAPKLYTELDELNWEIDPVLNIPMWTNPLSFLKKKHEATSGALFANSTIGYEFLKGLKAVANVGYSETNSKEHLIEPIASRAPVFITGSTTGTAVFGNNSRKSWLIEPQLLYIKEINKHSISTVLGGTIGQISGNYESVRGSGYTSDALLSSPLGASALTFTINDSKYIYTSAYIRVGYDWNSRYLLDLIWRRDGSSRFGPNNRFGNFGGIGAGWIFSNENFMQSLANFMTFGKIRGSYAVTGNDQIGDYRFYDTYNVSMYKYQGTTALNPTSLFNPDFQWEVTKKFELGLELRLIKNRIQLDASWFRNRSSNQLVDYELPATAGFNTVFRNFDATVENSGYELNFSSVNISSDNLRWTTSINFTLPKNKLVEFPDIEVSPYRSLYKVGEPLSIQKLFVYKGVNPQTGLHEVFDRNEDGSFNDDDMVFMKPTGRKYFGGVSNSIAYKNFELTFLLQFSSSTTVGYLPSLPPGRISNQQVEVLNRWRTEGDITDVAKFSTQNASLYSNIVRFSDRNTIDASFIRLKTLSLTYSLPKSLSQKIGLQDAKAFMQGQNLFTVTDFVGWDPETGSLTAPPLRMITLGIQLNF